MGDRKSEPEKVVRASKDTSEKNESSYESKEKKSEIARFSINAPQIWR